MQLRQLTETRERWTDGRSQLALAVSSDAVVRLAAAAAAAAAVVVVVVV